nr:putative mitochondrial protein [Quercus suber]
MGVDIEVVFSDKNMIVALVYSDPPEAPWLLFAIYGPYQRSKKRNFWVLLESMVAAFLGPWVVIRDFNCIKWAREKCGWRIVAESSTNCLRDFMMNSGAIELGFIGPSFTWSNRREGLASIRERLDQCLCDQAWQSLFPKAGVRHLCNLNSDHNPIMLDTNLETEMGSQSFWFEAIWTKKEGSNVENAWQTRVEAILKAFGFSSSFTKLIHQCLSSVEFTLLLNGGQYPSFSPSRGLRQGDPLSPYLFILGSEVLLRLLNREVSQKRLSGVKVSNIAPPISKLCYADDIILSCKAKFVEIAILKSCLEKFCSWSGQLISVEKFGCFASKGFSRSTRNFHSPALLAFSFLSSSLLLEIQVEKIR